MSVVTFTDYIPVPRFDGIPWNSIRIYEGPEADGPWTLIDTIVITDPDADPRQPKARSFTTDNDTLTEGWYQVRFADANGNVLTTAATQNIPLEQSSWLPTPSDVGLVLLSRTKDTLGNELGTFTSDTRPNGIQVMRIVEKAALDVADVTGDNIPEPLWDDAKNVVALCAAMMIELAYYPEQVNTGRSIYPQLKEQYEYGLKELSRAVGLMNEGETSVSSAAAGGKPQYSFPASSTGIGFSTRW